jgi:hypothetical protein
MMFDRAAATWRARRQLRAGTEPRNGSESERKIEVIDFTCPFGQHTYERDEQDALAKVHERKMTKYREYVTNLQELQEKEVRLTVIVFSLMRAIYSKSLKAVRDLFGCTKTELPKIRRRVTETAIM